MLLGRLRIRLVDDWHKAASWSSVRLIAFGAAVKVVLVAWPTLADYLPSWFTQTVAVLTFLGLLLAARLTTTEKTNDLNSH